MSESYEVTMLKVRMAEMQNDINELRNDLRLVMAGFRRIVQERGEQAYGQGASESPSPLHVVEGH